MSTKHMSKPLDEQELPERNPVAGPPQFSTLSVHGGEARQKAGDSITDPIFCASTYTFTDTPAIAGRYSCLASWSGEATAGPAKATRQIMVE